MAGRSSAVATPVGLFIPLSVPSVESSDGNRLPPATASTTESAQTATDIFRCGSCAQVGLMSPTTAHKKHTEREEHENSTDACQDDSPVSATLRGAAATARSRAARTCAPALSRHNGPAALRYSATALPLSSERVRSRRAPRRTHACRSASSKPRVACLGYALAPFTVHASLRLRVTSGRRLWVRLARGPVRRQRRHRNPW